MCVNYMDRSSYASMCCVIRRPIPNGPLRKARKPVELRVASLAQQFVRDRA
jgi:hypothetical protein